MADAVTLVRQIVAEETADLRERLQHLEAKQSSVLTPEQAFQQGELGAVHPDESGAMGGDPPPQAEQLRELLQRHEDMVAAIKALHRLDASPVQWTRDNGGKMVEAPDGLWEISCLACNHQTVWREGDSKPPQCKTWRIANGDVVQ